MNLICENDRCRQVLKDIDVLKNWDSRKLKAALAAFGGDKASLREHQEAAAERATICPGCGAKMSRVPIQLQK